MQYPIYETRKKDTFHFEFVFLFLNNFLFHFTDTDITNNKT